MNIKFILKRFPNQPPEYYYGNKEYKICIDYDKKTKKYIDNNLQKKATQMLFRLIEGNGKAIYLIGVDDDGNSKGIILSKLLNSLYNLFRMSKIINSIITKINIYNGPYGYIATIRIIKNIDSHIQL